MMTENINLRQSDGHLKRRWFSDDYFDLIVWENKNKDIVRFELCYKKFKDEHAFVWNQETGYSHFKVDDGEQISERLKMSPIFIAGGIFDSENLGAKFLCASRRLDPKVAKFIFNQIIDYNKTNVKG